jgi:hypothetical protein
MQSTEEALFQLMRFNILSSVRVDLENSRFSPSYIYAWESLVYPLFNDGASWHKPFGSQFKVSESEVDELSKILDESWNKKDKLTFYELENRLGVRGSISSSTWERSKLIRACRYMYLEDLFDKDFWTTLTRNGDCPSEALSICRPLQYNDIYFM